MNNIETLLRGIRTVAVLGIRSEKFADRPAFYVPQAVQARGVRIIPVPVYEPEVTEILGEKVYRKLQDIPDAIDLVNVFRRSEDLPKHVDDILALKPKAVWFQSGIRNDEVATTLRQAGIEVVQDRCLMVEYRRVEK